MPGSLLAVGVTAKIAPARQERTATDKVAVACRVEPQALAVLRTSGMKKTNMLASTMVKAMK